MKIEGNYMNINKTIPSCIMDNITEIFKDSIIFDIKPIDMKDIENRKKKILKKINLYKLNISLLSLDAIARADIRAEGSSIPGDTKELISSDYKQWIHFIRLCNDIKI